MRFATTALLLSVLIAPPARADDEKPAVSPQKAAAIRQLLEASGGAAVGMQVMDMLLESFKQTFPGVPADFWTEFRAEVRAEDLVELIVPIYDRHLTESEIRELTAFYESPIGKKLVQVQPLIAKESMEAGQAWGQALGEAVAKRLRAKGYLTRSDARRDAPQAGG